MSLENVSLYAASPRQLISAFAIAADNANEQILESILHPAFRVVFCVKTESSVSPTTVLSRNLFLEMVREGKIGGKERSVSISELSITNGFASVSAVMSHSDAEFHGNYSLIVEDGNWFLLQESVTMVPTTGKPN
jgi:Putative lumazine-binding